jgi:hypothetical protein
MNCGSSAARVKIPDKKNPAESGGRIGRTVSDHSKIEKGADPPHSIQPQSEMDFQTAGDKGMSTFPEGGVRERIAVGFVFSVPVLL